MQKEIIVFIQIIYNFKVMKKIVIFFITLLLIECNTSKSKIRTDLERQDLKGKVKSIKSVAYRAIEKFGKIQKGNENSIFFYTFNKDGNFIECISNEKENNSRQTFIYNDQGNIIEQKEYDFKGNLKSQTTYSYDRKGNKIEENSFEGYQFRRSIYKYDNKCREVETLITISIKGINGSIELRKIKEYNNEGNIIEEKTYDNNNNLVIKGIYTYDEKGNIIKNIFVGSDTNEIEEKYIYTYDKNSNKIEEQKYISEHLVEKTIIKYDKKGNILKKNITDFNRNMSFLITSKNDEKGNAIERIYYINGNPNVIEEIEIKYY